jgi:hypothetical protein
MKIALAALVLVLGASAVWAQSQPPAEMTLPAKPGIYAIDPTTQPPSPMRLRASEVRFNRHTGNNFARNSFYMNSKTTLDLEGKTAEISLPAGRTTFLVPADPESPELSLSRLTLVRLEPQADKRILAAMKANFLGGAPGRKVDAVAVAKETLKDGNWVRVTPTADLAPGEYAIAYFPADPRMFPDSVFDFRIGPDK